MLISLIVVAGWNPSNRDNGQRFYKAKLPPTNKLRETPVDRNESACVRR